MKLTNRDQKKFKTFCDKYKSYVGFNGWEIKIEENMLENSSSLSEIGVDIFEKQLFIYISKDFLSLDNKRKSNVLMHELVHGRILYCNMKIREMKCIEEEHMANDITRGFEMVRKLELKC